MKRHSALVLLFLATAAVPSLAVPVMPTSYAMPNGSGQAHGGDFNYWDKTYSGTGSTTTDGASLAGGLGDLTDGFVTTKNWIDAENTAGTGPYVGWNRFVTPELAITFAFATPVSIDAIRIHADDSGGRGGVSLPFLASFTWAEGSVTRSVVDPDTSTGPSWLDFSGLSIDDVTELTVELTYRTNWVFVDEVTFAAAPVPEPGVAALLLVGFAATMAIARRRRVRGW